MSNEISRRDTLARFGGAAAFAQIGLQGAETAFNVAGSAVELLVTPVSLRTLRVSLLRVSPNGSVEQTADDPAIVIGSGGKPIIRTRSLGSPRNIKWGDYHVRLSTGPLSVSVEDQSGRTIQLLRIDGAGEITFKNASGPVFGLGEGGPQFDRRNQQYTMQNGQSRPLLANVGARMPIPWLLAADGWALFFHRPFGTIDLTGQEYRFQRTADAPAALPIDLFLVLSNEPADLLKEYAGVTGFPHMPPLWALGYQQSHRTLASREEVMDEAKKFRKEGLPCDAMIYLGTGFCPSGWNTGHGSFTFNKAVFPDPQGMIAELHQEHFRVILHLTMPPDHIKGRVTDSGAAAEDVNDAAHYWATHLQTFRLGIDGWWPDEGDKLSPESRIARNQMYWEGPLKERPNERPFALHRNGYAGLQRYGWLWSGDVDCTWKTLQQQIPVGLNTGLTGIPYWGTDTGGFVPTKELTGELYVRWFQFSAFCPLFRSHGRTWKLRLPWGWNTGEYGPSEVDESRLPDPKELHNSDVLPICKKYLELRYRLLPYTYSAVREAHETGMPLMRALWLHYPNDAHALTVADEYLWGRDVLVAPVIRPGSASRQVYLPDGDWYDFWTGELTKGGRTIERAVDLATLPLYVRAGTVLPMAPVKQYVTQSSADPITLRVYSGLDGGYTLYVDDGESFAYEHGEFMRLTMHWNDRNRQLRLALAPGSKKVWNGYQNIQVELPGGKERKAIRFEGKPIVVQV